MNRPYEERLAWYGASHDHLRVAEGARRTIESSRSAWLCHGIGETGPWPAIDAPNQVDAGRNVHE